MDGVIQFIDSGSDFAAVDQRHRVAARAMRRYFPHVVEWHCPHAGAPIAVRLPENLSAKEVLRQAERAQVQVASVQDPAAPDRAFAIHYAHLAEAEIEEGIRRLGHCLVGYTQMAARLSPGQPSTLVGT